MFYITIKVTLSQASLEKYTSLAIYFKTQDSYQFSLLSQSLENVLFHIFYQLMLSKGCPKLLRLTLASLKKKLGQFEPF